MNPPEKMHSQLLKARGKRAAFLEPSNAALNHIATTIAFPVVADWPPSVALLGSIGSWRYHRSDAMRVQPVANALRVIGFVTTNATRSRARSSFRALHLHTVDQCLELSRLVRLPWQQQRAQRHAISIDEEVHLAPKPADTAS